MRCESSLNSILAKNSTQTQRNAYAAQRHLQFGLFCAPAGCVTLSMDDLKVFQHCPPTHRIVVTAEVTRAFTTSMEVRVGVEGVDHARLHTSTSSRVPLCQSYFTFVALGAAGPDGKRAKVPLQALSPRTPEG